jgi:hypothetical protein
MKVAQLWIAGVAGAFMATLLLPWFRETSRNQPTRTVNAIQAGWPWAIGLATLAIGFAIIAMASLRREALTPVVFAVIAVLGALVFTRCWLHLDPTIPGGRTERRWGLFVALNTPPLFGFALRQARERLAREAAPTDRERDNGFGI